MNFLLWKRLLTNRSHEFRCTSTLFLLPYDMPIHIRSFALLACAITALCWSPSHGQPHNSVIVRPLFQTVKPNPRDLTPLQSVKRPKIGLVLSGGSARGAAQLGVLKVLEQHSIPIDAIVGSSMGAIIGGLYASGYSTAQLQALLDTTKWNDVLAFADESERTNLFVGQKQTVDRNLLTIRFDGLKPIIPSSLSSGQRLTNFINRLALQGIYHPAPSFDDLKIPFRAVATDIISGRKIVMGSGDLSEALRASMAIPLLYTGVKKDTLELIDGGILNNIPVDVARDMGMDIVIAVNTSSPLRPATQMNAPWEKADQIIGIMAQEANRQSLEKATIVMTPALGDHLAGDFTDLDSLMHKGMECAESMLSPLMDSIASKQAEEFGLETEAAHALLHLSRVSIAGDSTPQISIDSLENALTDKAVTILDIRKTVSDIYASGEYRDVYAEIDFLDTLMTMTLHVAPNPVVHAIRLDGTSLIPIEELIPFFTPLKERRLNSRRGRIMIDQLLSHYRDNGYSLARILKTEIDTVNGLLTITIDEGVIAKMSIEGTEKTRNWVIWREMTMNDHDVFTVAKADQSITNVSATGLFDQILLEIRYVGSDPHIIVKATERKSELIRIGARYDNERNLQPSLELRDNNFFGTATEIGTSLSGGLRNLRFTMEARANRILNSFFTFSMGGYYNARDVYVYVNDPTVRSATKFGRMRVGEYNQSQYGGVFSLGRQVERLGNITAEYRLEATHVASLSGVSGGHEELTLQAFRVHSTVDTQDKFPFPTAGSLMTISYETATSHVAGDIGYSKIFFSYEWFSTVFRRHTLHPKFVFGFADETLPLSQQFSLGGENSFYGLAQEDSRGRQLFLLNIEYRFSFPYSLVWDTYLLARYDLGSIWPTQSAIRLADFHHGIGVGFGLDTPVGPAKLCIGRSFFFRRDLLDQPLSLGPILGYFSVGYEF